MQWSDIFSRAVSAAQHSCQHLGLETSIGAAAAAIAEPSILTGTVTHVRDGDTIEVGEVPVRLNGVSAPELDEPWGALSKKFVHDLVVGQPVRCELNGQKTYDRFVGICYLKDKDIGVSVIKAGLALDCPVIRTGGT